MNPFGLRAFNLLINHADQFCCNRFPLKKTRGLTYVSFYRRLRTSYLTCSVCMRDCMSYFILPVLQILLSNSRLCPGRLMKMECPIFFWVPSPHHFIFRSVAAPGKTAMLKCCLVGLRRRKIRVPGEKTSLSRKRKQN